MISAEYNKTRNKPEKAAMIVFTDCCGIRKYVSQTVMVPDGRIICEHRADCADLAQWQHIINQNAGD